jgi:hypothetical protein
MLHWKRNSLTSGNCTLRNGKEATSTFAGRRDGLSMLCRKRNSLTSGNCTLRDGKKAMIRVLGGGIVWLCCVGRGTAGRVAIVR